MSAAKIGTIAKDIDAFFWATRPELRRIADFAHARMVSRWALLGAVLVRVACSTPPNVVLPPIIGGDASTNLFVALVGPSGAGKSGAIAAAGEVISTKVYLPTVPLGSGEGIARSYAYRPPKKQELTWAERRIQFVAAEVDGLAALNGRQGSTLGSQLREMFNGGELGFGYADPQKRVILPAHSYRAGLVVGVQPGRSGFLLDDADGGTPQRFLWMPATDAHIPFDPEPAPEPWELPQLHWPTPTSFGSGENDDPSGKGIGKREELHVCPEAVDAIRLAAHQRATGVGGSGLDGHALLLKLKVAAALAILAGRKMVTEDDWKLAATVMRTSNRTRAEMAEQLRSSRAEVAERAGIADGIRQAGAEQVQVERRYQRVWNQMLAKTQGTDDRGDWWRRTTLRKSFASRDRDAFDELFPSLFWNEALKTQAMEGGPLPPGSYGPR